TPPTSMMSQSSATVSTMPLSLPIINSVRQCGAQACHDTTNIGAAAMMGMANGDRKRVCRVGAVGAAARQQDAHHCGNLVLLGMPGPDNRLLDLVRGVLGDRQSGLGGCEPRNPPRLAKLQGCRRIAVDEGLLDRRLVGRH